MKNKLMWAFLLFCVVTFSLYKGYGVWNTYLDTKETVAQVEWVVPLSKEYKEKAYSIEEDIDEEIQENKKALKKIGMKLLVVENKDKNYSRYYESLYGVESAEGKIIAPPIYTSINIDSDLGYILASNYDTEKYHFYRLDGSDFIPGDFTDASIFENGYACIQRDGKYNLIDIYGQRKLKIDCDDLTSFDSENGIYMFYTSFPSDFYGNWGLIDVDGNILLEPQYDWIDRASSNRLLVSFTNEGYQKYVYLTNDYKQFSKQTYKEASYFSNGIAVVQDKSNKWKIINEEEEVIAEVPHCIHLNPFREGVAIAEYQKKLLCIDEQGSTLFEIPYKNRAHLEFEMDHFENGYIVFMGSNGKLGYMNKKGKIVIKPIFDDAYRTENGTAYVEIGNKAGVIKL